MTDNSAHGYSEGSECVDCAKEKHELRQEIANHIAVNSLLTDSDGEADLANQIYKLAVQLKSKDEEIQAMKEERNKAIDDFYNMMDEELQTEPINRARYMIRLSQIKESLKSDSKMNTEELTKSI